MITNVFITKWEGISGTGRVLDATNGTNYLLNGNRINGVQVRASTKSQFMFSERLNDPKEKAAYIEATEAIGTIRAEIDKTWNSLIAGFNFYTDNDTTKATFLRYINVESLAWATPDAASVQRTWIKFYEAGKAFTLLCDNTIKEVQSQLDSGNLTTTAG